MIDVPTFTDHDFLDDIKSPRCISDDNVRIVLLMKLPESWRNYGVLLKNAHIFACEAGAQRPE